MASKNWIDSVSTSKSSDAMPTSKASSTQKINEDGSINLKAFEFFTKGVQHFQSGQLDQGFSCITKAIELDPKNVEYRISKGNAFRSLDKNSEALRCYEDAIEINPKCADGYMGKGHILIERHRFKDALSMFNICLEINPKKEEYLYSKGNTLKLLQKYDEAIKCLDEALSVNPSFSAAYQAKGEVLNEKEQFEEALVYLTKAVEINPKESALTSKAFCLMSLKRYKEALDACDEVLKINPYDVIAVALKAKCLYDTDNFQLAIKEYSKAAELDPQNQTYATRVRMAKKKISKK